MFCFNFFDILFTLFDIFVIFFVKLLGRDLIVFEIFFIELRSGFTKVFI